MSDLSVAGVTEGRQETGCTVLIRLCQDLERLRGGLDLEEIAQGFGETDPKVFVETVDHLCEAASATPSSTDYDVDRLVLGLCTDAQVSGLDEARLREAGFDPLGVERVNLGGYCAAAHPREGATNKAKVLMTAAIARVRAFRGSTPAQLKPRLGSRAGKMSRRAMFRLPAVRYQPVISIDEDGCMSETGCRHCVDVCPSEALIGTRNRVSLDQNKCVGCGLCVTECPRLVIDLPSHSATQISAELATLLKTPCPTLERRVILFICEGSAAILPSLAAQELSDSVVWLPLRVPCAGMVPAAWMIGALAGGANAVIVVGCTGSCPNGQDERIAGRIAYCRELLTRVGASPDRVRHMRATDVSTLAGALTEPLAPEPRNVPAFTDGLVLPGPQAMATATLALAQSYSADVDFSFAHPYSPHGLVHIDGDACTVCERCAVVCPTAALTVQRCDGMVAIDFDAARCTGCELCAGQCPEAIREAISVDHVTDGIALSQGRSTLHQDEEVRCVTCDAAIGPRAMLRRIESLVTSDGEPNDGTMSRILSRCPECRVSTPFARP